MRCRQRRLLEFDLEISLGTGFGLGQQFGESNHLQGALAQLKAFKKKLEDGLVNETLPDDVRRAAVPPLETSGQLQSLILLALGCTEAPC